MIEKIAQIKNEYLVDLVRLKNYIVRIVYLAKIAKDTLDTHLTTTLKTQPPQISNIKQTIQAQAIV
ncbi:hypothetical protein VCR15J2_290100 [Vibrio coralliirubri]|nr:hypothetical protein VCR15J2_290100 [Vibrio coralliirubri]